MNELERWIVDVGVPGPSNRLDERIGALFTAGAAASRRRRGKDAWLRWGTAACLGVVGFFLGRHSVNVPAAVTQPVEVRSVPDLRQPTSTGTAQVVSIPLHEDQVASFFVRPPAREGMLGKGAVRFDVVTSP